MAEATEMIIWPVRAIFLGLKCPWLAVFFRTRLSQDILYTYIVENLPYFGGILCIFGEF
jgi:hypothetical protein